MSEWPKHPMEAKGKAGETPPHRRHILRWSVALVLAGVAAWLCLRQVRLQALYLTLAQARLAPLALALISVLATTAAKAARWWVLLRPCGGQIGRLQVFRVLLIGQMGNSLLPARLGDVARITLLAPKTTGGIPAVAGTLLAEKTLDGVMGLTILLGLVLWTPLPAWLWQPALALASLTGALLVMLVLMATRSAWRARFFEGPISWLPPGRRSQLERLVSGFRLGLAALSQRSAALAALGWSVVVWVLAALTNLAALDALNIGVPSWTIWLILFAGYAANFLPAVPGQVGVFEYACILALQPVGVQGEQALAFALILHMLIYAPPAILGPICTLLEGVSWSSLKGAQHGYLELERAP